MRMVLHGVADDVGDLGVAAVVLLPERVEDAALHRLEPVLDGGDGARADDVGGVLAEVEVVEVAHRAGAGERQVRGRGSGFVARGSRLVVRGLGLAACRGFGLGVRGWLAACRVRGGLEQIEVVEQAGRLGRLLWVLLGHLLRFGNCYIVYYSIFAVQGVRRRVNCHSKEYFRIVITILRCRGDCPRRCCRD